MSRNPWSLLIVLRLRVADPIKLWRACQHASAEPDGVALHVMGDYVYIDWGGVGGFTEGTEAGDVGVHSGVDSFFDVSVQATAEVLEHGGAAGEDDVVVEPAAGVDGAAKDGVVDDFGEGGEELAGEDLGVEENFRAEEPIRRGG